jgi:hypothetical protein
MKEKLERYAELKLAIKEAEKEIDLLSEELKAEIEVGQAYDIGSAKISMNQGRPKWIYSVQTQSVEEELKTTKKEEEQLGVATATYGEPFLTCTFPRK